MQSPTMPVPIPDKPGETGPGKSDAAASPVALEAAYEKMKPRQVTLRKSQA